jgi:hypothetical protein
LQDPYRLALQDALGEPENRVLFLIDVVVGALVVPHFAEGADPT